ncbi:uncharacterized protein C8R40DRAFT_1178044 [Lentinula edodes]|uniref:uncharacterized protein n=1 Tax=Lentinula edodes TaxID=5353 RepID=UPI001E8CCD11|nr:uncharacterized protein C8R40DRAFT_1178044 [Lentinula edodes]KAH7868224.1 hypothetical protein C8R40DRAFT_1178044 [Lentinula edodes]
MPQITCAEVQNELFDIAQAFTVASHLMEDSDNSNDDSFQLDDGFDDEEAQNFDGEFTDSVVVRYTMSIRVGVALYLVKGSIYYNTPSYFHWVLVASAAESWASQPVRTGPRKLLPNPVRISVL